MKKKMEKALDLCEEILADFEALLTNMDELYNEMSLVADGGDIEEEEAEYEQL